MTEIENKQAAGLPEKPDVKARVPVPERSHGGISRTSMLSVVSVFLSVVALVISCTALTLQLKAPAKADEEPEAPAEESAEQEPPTLQYRNHILPILENVPVNSYDAASFHKDENGFIRYQDAPLGIDVSSHQGEIDWQTVAESGIGFAMIRVGLRGYTKGGIMADAMFEQNIKGALAAGLDVGVYFFSQAINVWEAEEEAAYVIEQIKDYSLTYPVVFDWESVDNESARTNGVGSDEVTRCAGAFCDMIAEAGYTPMIYFNMDQGYLAYRLDRLSDYAFWLAEYHDSPAFYYQFVLWQYTHQGKVPGINGSVDLDLDLREYAALPE